MIDGLHRALTGQTISQRELYIGAGFVLVWFLMDLIQFVDWIAGKL